MKATAYDYATIGFRPYPETQEFVTVGIVALDSKTSEFGFHLANPRKVGKVNRMFPNLPKDLYASALKMLQQELEAIEEAINYGPKLDQTKTPLKIHSDSQGLFNAITSPREGLFSYQAKGRRLAPNLEEALTKLRLRLMDHEAISPAIHIETQMARSMAKLFRRAGIMRHLERNVEIGPKEFQVRFPFARMSGHQRAKMAIKTLNFDLPATTDIFNHGDEWTQKLRRLKKVGYRPDQCLFTIREPHTAEGKSAYLQIRAELLEQGALLVDEHDDDSLLRFTSDGNQQPDFGLN